jgi:DnaJ-class molecular chaperone
LGKIMKKAVVWLFFALLIAYALSVKEVNATGPFDQVCPNCHGTGTIVSHETETCPVCHGEGETTTTSTCPVCHGSGETSVWQTCTRCGGDGEVMPSVKLQSMNGYSTLSGLDWIARVEGVFHNEEDVGTYGKAKSVVHTLAEDFVHFSDRTYFPAHEDVTITIDTPEITVNTDWTYTIYLFSVDDITCPDCDGSGGKSVLVTCSECDGTGTVTTTEVCSNCQGTGKITTEKSETCPVCNGNGYVTNWTNVSIVAIVIVAVFAGTSALIFHRRRSQKQ